MRSEHLLATVASIALLPALASPALAQTPPADEPQLTPGQTNEALTEEAGTEAATPSAGIGEIVITATRRASNLQRTPIAVTAVDQTLIQQSDADNIGELAMYVPNFSAETITGFNAASFAMRGVGQNNIIVYFEPPVVALVDDFVMPSVQTQLLDTFDVAQIEVLRGPQGTLFGKNSSGGAVTVKTKRPELGNFFADGRVILGSFGTREVKGAINVALGDIAALRVVGGFEKSDGYYKNQACYGPILNFTAFAVPPTPFVPSKFDGVQGCLDDGRVGGKDVVNARVKLLIEPTPAITALFQYEILRDRSDTVPSVNENQLYTGTVPFLTDLLNFKVPNNSSDPLKNSGITLRDDTFQRDHQRIDVDGLYGNIDWDVGVGTITSVTGWRKQKSRLPNSYAGVTAVAADGERLSFFDASRDDDRKTFQQEVRFASDFNGPFDFVAGAFYQRDTVDFCVSQLLGFLDLVSPGPLPFGRWNQTPFILCNAQKAKSSAIFAEGNYLITDKLTLTAGLRQTWDDKVWRGRQQVFIPQLNGGFDPAITIDEPLDASVYNYSAGVIKIDDKSDKLTYRISLGYQANNDVFLYATHATGYKGGGFNDQIGGFAPFGADLDAFREAARPTEPETASSWEAGVKSFFLDRRVRANVTGFYVEYKDLQRQLNVPIVVNGAPNQVTIFLNAAAATVKGIEAELTAKPVDNLTLRGILGYQDAKYDKYSTPIATYDLATSPLDRAPKWQWTLATNYIVPLGGHKLMFDGSIAYQDKNLFTQSSTDPLGNTFLNARTLVNASITFAEIADRYYLRLVGQNLTDKRYRTASQNVAGLWLNSQYGPPRYFGIEAGFHFQPREAALPLPPPPAPPPPPEPAATQTCADGSVILATDACPAPPPPPPPSSGERGQ
jgi:iron complex outermembrane receptor protein